MRWLVGSFLVAHGLIHGAFLAKPPLPKPGAPVWPFYLDRSWLLSGLGIRSSAVKLLGSQLAGLTIVALIGAGIGLIFRQDWWRPVAIIGTGSSVLLLGLYYQSWLIVGLGISAAMMIAILWLGWPPLDIMVT